MATIEVWPGYLGKIPWHWHLCESAGNRHLCRSLHRHRYRHPLKGVGNWQYRHRHGHQYLLRQNRYQRFGYVSDIIANLQMRVP